MKECGMCPAFLFDKESILLNLCFGCRQPPARYRVEKDGTVTDTRKDSNDQTECN